MLKSAHLLGEAVGDLRTASESGQTLTRKRLFDVIDAATRSSKRIGSPNIQIRDPGGMRPDCAGRDLLPRHDIADHIPVSQPQKLPVILSPDEEARPSVSAGRTMSWKATVVRQFDDGNR
jgi:hypothetical protein